MVELYLKIELMESLCRRVSEENEKLKQEIDILKEKISSVNGCKCNNYAKKLGDIK